MAYSSPSCSASRPVASRRDRPVATGRRSWPPSSPPHYSASGTSAANRAATDLIGAGSPLLLIGTVILTGTGGLGLCYVRARSDSVLAPMIAHFTLNGLGVLAVAAYR